jgi:hypothetical protein
MQRLAGIEAGAVAYVANLPAHAKRFQLQELIESHARAGALVAPERALAIGEFDALFVIPDAVFTKAKSQLKEAEAKPSVDNHGPAKRPFYGYGKGGQQGKGYGPFPSPQGAPPGLE